MRISEILNELTFHGSQCTKDCSGHKAGYEWSKARGNASPCDAQSSSFNNGCNIAKSGAARPKIRTPQGKFAPNPQRKKVAVSPAPLQPIKPQGSV